MPRSSFGNCSLTPFRKWAIISPASIALSFLICCSLFFSSLVLAKPATPNGQSQTRGGRPEPGPPAATLPNLDQVRREHPLNAEAPAAQPSVIRARRKPLLPRNGRTVGDALTEGTGNNSEQQSPPSDGNPEAVGQLSSNSAPLLTKSAKTKRTQRVISHHAAKHGLGLVGCRRLLPSATMTTCNGGLRMRLYARRLPRNQVTGTTCYERPMRTDNLHW